MGGVETGAAKTRRIFCHKSNLDETTRILAAGSENGENINPVLTGTPVAPENVCLADIEPGALDYGRENSVIEQFCLLDASEMGDIFPKQRLFWIKSSAWYNQL